MILSTVAERLAGLAEGVKESCRTLLEGHSSIHHEPTSTFGGGAEMTPWGMRRRGGMVMLGYSIWKPLAQEGARAQAEALRRYRAFAEIAKALLAGQPTQVLNAFQENDRIVTAAIEQQREPNGGTPADVLGQMVLAFDGMAGPSPTSVAAPEARPSSSRTRTPFCSTRHSRIGLSTGLTASQ